MFSVGHIGIPTNDFIKTVVFYRDLGFEIIYETVLDDGVHVAFIEVYGVIFEFYEGESLCPSNPTIKKIVINTQKEERNIVGPSGEHIQLQIGEATGLDHIVINTTSYEGLKKDLTSHGFIEGMNGFKQGNVTFLIQVIKEEKVTTGSVNHIAFDESKVLQKAILIKEGHLPIVEGINFLPFFENGVIYFVTENQDSLRLEYNQML